MLSIPIVSEFDGKGIKKAIAEFKQLETTGEKAQFALKKALVPATAALGGLAVAAKGAVSAASDMAEAQSKVNVIFGDGAAEIAKFAATASSKIGQSKKAVMDAAGTFGTFGKAAGLGGKDLAKFSTGFTALASDLASFNNTSPEEAIQAIGAALRGESEPMRKYGVLLNDATLKAEAMALGIYDGNGALTAQQKILAAQSAIYKQTGDAQGDFERTSSGLANSQRTLKAQFDDMQVSLGQALLPAVNALLPKVKAFADWAAANPETFKIIAGSIAAVAAAIVAVNAASAANPYVIMAAAVIGLAVAFDRLAESVGRFNTRAGRQLKRIGGMLGIPTLPDDPLNWQSWLGINTKATPPTGGGLSIPAMANGGIVTSPTLALIGEAGPEAVVPLNKAGGMGNVNITVTSANPDAVVDAIVKWSRRNGSLPPSVRVA